MEEDQAEFIEIMRTGKPYEIDMAANVLQEKGIPFIRRSHMGALTTAMPMTPTPGPGVSWSLEVPRVAIEDANVVLAQLPIHITRDPGQWDFAPKKSVERAWSAYRYVLGVVVGLALVAALVNFVETLFR